MIERWRVTYVGGVQLIMREFNAYIKEASRDAVLIAATIQAIGRVAAWMPALTDSCVRGLMQLIQTSKRQDMVAESVVVVRALVQQAPEARVKIVRQLARLIDTIHAPDGRDPYPPPSCLCPLLPGP